LDRLDIWKRKIVEEGAVLVKEEFEWMVWWTDDLVRW